MPATVGERRPGESRDALAAHDLFERYRTPIYRFCLSRLRSPEDAEDAVQSTFLRAYSALQRGVEPQHASAWLLKIAHNVCLSRRLAALRRRRVETPRDLGELPDATLASPQAETEELFGLEDALAALPPRMRSVLLLREWQGLSYREIAAEVGASEAAVETLLFRARRELARRLREPWERLAGILFGPFAGLRSVFGASSAPVLATAASVAVVVAAAPSVAHQAPPSPRTSVGSAQPIPRPALSAPAQLGAAARLRLRRKDFQKERFVRSPRLSQRPRNRP